MRRIAVRAIITDGEKMFLAKLRHIGGDVNAFYCTIGGGLDESESLIDGIKREVIEETGITPKVGKLIAVQQYTDKHDNIEFFFHITNTEDFKNIDLSNTSHGEQEIAELGFYEIKDLEVLPKFLKEIDLKNFENINEVKFYNYL